MGRDHVGLYKTECVRADSSFRRGKFTAPERRRVHHRRLRRLIQPAAPHAPPRPSTTHRSRGPLLFPTRDRPAGRLTKPRGCMTRVGSVFSPDVHPGGSHIRVDLSIVDPWATSVLFQTAGPLQTVRHVTRCEFRELVDSFRPGYRLAARLQSWTSFMDGTSRILFASPANSSIASSTRLNGSRWVISQLKSRRPDSTRRVNCSQVSHSRRPKMPRSVIPRLLM